MSHLRAAGLVVVFVAVLVVGTVACGKKVLPKPPVDARQPAVSDTDTPDESE